jgi:hypothetical protein
VGNLPKFPIYPLRKEDYHYHSQGSMVGGNTKKLRELVGKPCCTWCFVMENKGCVELSALFMFICIDFYKGRESNSFLIDIEY